MTPRVETPLPLQPRRLAAAPAALQEQSRIAGRMLPLVRAPRRSRSPEGRSLRVELATVQAAMARCGAECRFILTIARAIGLSIPDMTLADLTGRPQRRRVVKPGSGTPCTRPRAKRGRS